MERAVARNVDNLFIRAADLCADGCAVAVAHGAKPARGQELARMAAAAILRRPHLMLSDVGDNDGVIARDVCNRTDNLMGTEFAVIVLGTVIELFLPLGNLCHPRGMLVFLNKRQHCFEESFGVRHNGIIGCHVLIDFGCVNIHMDDLCRRCKAIRIGRNAVGEPRAERNHQICLINRKTSRNLAVHADHAEIQRIIDRQ